MSKSEEKFPQWPIQPTFLSLIENVDEDSKDINNEGMFYPDFLQGFLGSLANHDDIKNPLTLVEFVPEKLTFNGEKEKDVVIERIVFKDVDPFLQKNIKSKDIIRVDSGKQFKLRECCSIFRENCDTCKKFCWKQDSRVAILADERLVNKCNYDIKFKSIMDGIIDEYNDYYKLSKEYRVNVDSISIDGKEFVYLHYLCPESQLLEFIFPIFYSGNIIACMIQGQIPPQDFENRKKHAFPSIKDENKRVKIDEYLKTVIYEGKEVSEKRLQTIAKRIITFEKRIKDRIELNKQHYINLAFGEVNNTFHEGIKKIKGSTPQNNPKKALEELRMYADKALYQLWEKFKPENIFIRMFGIDAHTSKRDFFLFAKSDTGLEQENYKFRLVYEDFWNKHCKDLNNEICTELTGEARKEVVNSFSHKDLIRKEDILRLLPTLSPKIAFIIWKRYNDTISEPENIENIFKKKLIDFYIFIVQAYASIVGMENEQMLETSIRVAGHEAGNILPKAQKFVRIISSMTSYELLKEIKSGKYDKKIQDLDVQLELIKNIYDKPRLIFKDIDPTRASLQLSNLLIRMANVFRSQASVHKQSIPALDDSLIKIFIEADNELFSHVLYNLLDNAVKYGHEGSNIYLTAKEKGGKLYISVINYGSEIKPDEPIYDLYYRGTNQKYKKEGLGIGMALCKRIIRSHQFRISHESEFVAKEHLPVKAYQQWIDNKPIDEIRSDVKNREVVAIHNDKLQYQPGTLEIQTLIDSPTFRNTFSIEIPSDYYTIKH